MDGDDAMRKNSLVGTSPKLKHGSFLPKPTTKLPVGNVPKLNPKLTQFSLGVCVYRTHHLNRNWCVVCVLLQSFTLADASQLWDAFSKQRKPSQICNVSESQASIRLSPCWWGWFIVACPTFYFL